MCFPVTVDSKLFTNKEKDRVEYENPEKLQMIKPVLQVMLLGIFVIVAVTEYRPDAGTDSDGGSWVHKILAAGMQTTESQTVKAGKKVKVLI